MTEGPQYGYYPKSSNSFLIVKQHQKEYSERIFAGSNIKITTVGARHLGAVLGDISLKEEYLRNEVQSWKNQLEILSKIAEIQSQAAYSAYMFGFKHKFTFFLRTVPDITDYLFPIEETLKKKMMKNELKTRKISNFKIKLEELRNSMNEKMKRCEIFLWNLRVVMQ